jgi:hypothetical protein
VHLRHVLAGQGATGRPGSRQSRRLRQQLAAESRPPVVSRLARPAFDCNGIAALFNPSLAQRR